MLVIKVVGRKIFGKPTLKHRHALHFQLQVIYYRLGKLIMVVSQMKMNWLVKVDGEILQCSTSATTTWGRTLSSGWRRRSRRGLWRGRST